VPDVIKEQINLSPDLTPGPALQEKQSRSIESIIMSIPSPLVFRVVSNAVLLFHSGQL